MTVALPDEDLIKFPEVSPWGRVGLWQWVSTMTERANCGKSAVVIPAEARGAKPELDDNRAAILEAIDLALQTIESGSSSGATVTLGEGRFKVSSLEIPEGAKSLTLAGAGQIYGRAKGTTLEAVGAGAHLVELSPNCINVTIANMNLDGNCLKQSVLNFRDEEGKILDFTVLKDVSFQNCIDGGAFITNAREDMVGGECALTRLERCTFNQNSDVQVSHKGSAIRLRNRAAWGWLAEGCNFFGNSGDHGSVDLYSGELTIRDAEFENNAVHDIVMTGAAKLAGYNIHSQSPGPFLDILPVPDGASQALWMGDGVVLENLQHATTGATPAYSVRDTSPNPLRVTGISGFGIDVATVGDKAVHISDVRRGFVRLGAFETTAQSIVTQAGGEAGQNIHELYSQDRRNRFGIGYTKSTQEFALESYRPGDGYKPLSYASSRHRFMFGHLELWKAANLPAPPENYLGLACIDNGSGKMQLVVRFPTGAVQILATEE